MIALVADDDPFIREDNARTLRGMGFDVTEARSGCEAMIFLGAAWGRETPFDAVVLDESMPPGPCGLEILRCIRERGIDSPVVIASAADPFDRQEWPVNAAFLQKPFEPELLERVVRELVPGLAA